jgi:16S rRNA processing protein RimM
MDNGVQSVLVIEDDVKKQHLIPFVAPFILEVFLRGTDEPKIVVDWENDW